MEISVSPHIRGKYAYAASGSVGVWLGLLRVYFVSLRMSTKGTEERAGREDMRAGGVKADKDCLHTFTVIDRNGDEMRKLKRTIYKRKEKINKVLKEQSREMFQIISKCALIGLGQEINP
jgi:hypothetical protein